MRPTLRVIAAPTAGLRRPSPAVSARSLSLGAATWLMVRWGLSGTGLIHTNVLVVAQHDGQHYLVSMLGDGSEWVRNVRAAGGEAFVKRGRSRPVTLTEVPAEERGPILKAYCQVATSGRRHFPVPTTPRSPNS